MPRKKQSPFKKEEARAIPFKWPFFRDSISVPNGIHLGDEEKRMLWWWADTPGTMNSSPAHDPNDPRYQHLPVSSDCLPRFIELVDASDDDIKRFAEQYGVLGLWPASKSVPLNAEEPRAEKVLDHLGVQEFLGEMTQSERQAFGDFALNQQESLLMYGDSVDLYRRLSRYAKATLKIAAVFQHSGKPDEQAWQEVFPGETWPGNMQEVPQRLMEAFSLWARATPLFLQLYWEQDDNGNYLANPEVQFEDAPHLQSWQEAQYKKSNEERWQFRDIHDHRTFYELWPRRSRLFRLLTTQIVAALSGPVHSCDMCGSPFVAEKRNPQNRQDSRKKLCKNPECLRKRANERSSASYAKKRKAEARAKAAENAVNNEAEES